MTNTRLRVGVLGGLLALLLCTQHPFLYQGEATQDPPGGVLVDNAAPQWIYTGTTNNTDMEWEIGGAFTASWDITEDNPNYYFLYWNQTGSNTTYAEGSYTTTISGAYDPTLSDVSNTIYFNLKLNDTIGQTNSSIVYFSVVNTNPPTVQINRPENTTYTGGLIEIWLSSNSLDLAVLWWALYYANDTLREGNVTWTETVTRELPAGQYYLVGYCNDTAAYEDSETVWFTLSSAVVVGGPAAPGEEPVTAPIERMITTWPAQLAVILAILCGVAGTVYYFEKYPSLSLESQFLAYKKRTRRQWNALAQYFRKKKLKLRHPR